MNIQYLAQGSESTLCVITAGYCILVFVWMIPPLHSEGIVAPKHSPNEYVLKYRLKVEPLFSHLFIIINFDIGSSRS